MKHGQQLATGVRATEEDSKLWEAGIQLQCREAENSILAMQSASLALSAIKKAWDLDYRGPSLDHTVIAQSAKGGSHEGFQDHNVQQSDVVEPYLPLTQQDMQQKETHLHHAKGDSQLFEGTAWYLQSGVKISSAVVPSPFGNEERDSEDDEPHLLVGTQTLKCSGFTKGQQAPKCLRDIVLDNVVVDGPLSSKAEDSNLEMLLSKKVAISGPKIEFRAREERANLIEQQPQKLM
ncbi:hypothetical protein B0H13DRAFT_1930325 [Mycena leptocephala]|nr:hypothetical protein B0H13DRAFT_1930325 [Mycena leptocephala]